MPIEIHDVHNVSIMNLGKISASKNVRDWPRQPGRPKFYKNFIHFWDCSEIELYGGKIDGRGHHWWMLLFLDYFGINRYMPDQNARPHLILMERCTSIRIHDLVMKNSPQFHLKMDGCHNAELYNINIKVNVTAQANILKRFDLTDLMVMFPFNTDGIDPSGSNYHIYNLTVQNWDDVVVPKPSAEVNCTSNMLIENAIVKLGVGMSIGSVPPNANGNCIKNITFRNV